MSYLLLGPHEVANFPLVGLWLIEASAGTGKTYTIANLYLRHILAGRTVSELLVVTFTEAATDELRGRIRSRLSESLQLLEQKADTADEFLKDLLASLAQERKEEEAIRRIRLAVRSMDESAIYTIHGFCQRTLSEFAFNSGQAFSNEVITDDSAMWQEAVNDWWRRTTYSLDAAQADLFLTSVGDRQQFLTSLSGLLGPQPRRLLPEAKSLQILLLEFSQLDVERKELSLEWRKHQAEISRILVESPGLSRARTKNYHPEKLPRTLSLADDFFSSEKLLLPPDSFISLTAMGIDQARLKKPDPDLDHPFFAAADGFYSRYTRLVHDLRIAALEDAADAARQQVDRAKKEARLLSFDDLLTRTDQALKGETGEALAISVRQRYPVALIDEFQDTDPIQYRIFRQLYLDQPECSLIMIGDPKQAIYSFRGCDIFTYMQARKDVGSDSIYTLGTNWRSSPGMVGAVNRIFSRREDDAFVYGDSIPFIPVHAADREHRELLRAGVRQAPLTLWMLPVDEDAKGNEKPLSKTNAGNLCHEAVANEVASLIRQGQERTCLLGEDPIAPGDIAILVRTSFQAQDLRRVLAVHGVNAVSVERDGVFKTSEAEDLDTLLQAVIDPADRQLVRRALASPMLGRPYEEIDHLFQDEEQWAECIDDLLQLLESWQSRGFMAMFQKMLRKMELAESLSHNTVPERRLTNLLHLGELLQQAAREHPGMDQLRAWFRRRLDEPVETEAELRLESDEELVKIITIHSCKGLEFPVVFVPYLWDVRSLSADGGLLKFHQNNEACLYTGAQGESAYQALAEQERLAEDVRLAYVAMTRAESSLYLVWGRGGSDAGRTALAWLLHLHQSRQDQDHDTPNAFTGLNSLWPDVEELARQSKGSIRVVPIPDDEATIALKPGTIEQNLEPASFHGRIARDWRITSFSALTRDVHSGPPASRDHMEDDIAIQFPAGSHVGSYLHALFENIDFQSDIREQVQAESQRLATRFDLDHARWGAAAAEWVERVVLTPLSRQGPTLKDLAPHQRLNEVEFDFSTDRVNVERLNALLEQAAGEILQPLEIETFQGMVNGIIDLVFEHEGKYYIADYKSNFLGGRFSDYGPLELKKAVLERRYDLQYLLYTLAIHRFLGQRLPDYRYSQHMGGVYYLFLRGMQPPSGPDCGVYFDLPDRSLIEALDREVFRAPREEAA
jgi:exodeoxyribonuclease V beta subunit